MGDRANWRASQAGQHLLYCGLQSFDRPRSGDGEYKKFRAFGWNSVTINGHSHEEIYAALTSGVPGKPKAIIANTIKGRGIKIMENNPAWHHKAPSDEESNLMNDELNE